MKRDNENWANPELYRRMQVPHASEDAVNEAFGKFTDGVRALREECGIPEVVVLMQASVTQADGGEAVATGSLHLGCDALHDVMMARALGKMLVNRTQLLEWMRNGMVE